MLMDLFFKGARVARKQRVHFNSFMLDVHDSVFSRPCPLPTLLSPSPQPLPTLLSPSPRLLPTLLSPSPRPLPTLLSPSPRSLWSPSLQLFYIPSFCFLSLISPLSTSFFFDMYLYISPHFSFSSPPLSLPPSISPFFPLPLYSFTSVPLLPPLQGSITSRRPCLVPQAVRSLMLMIP